VEASPQTKTKKRALVEFTTNGKKTTGKRKKNDTGSRPCETKGWSGGVIKWLSWSSIHNSTKERDGQENGLKGKGPEGF